MRESLDPKKWWERAQHDREAAQRLFEADAQGLADVISYCCQQACEKMLKAYLLTTGWELVRTHDLPALGQETGKALPAIEALLPALVDLNADFAPSRYPFDMEERFSADDAKRALAIVEQLHSLLGLYVLGRNTGS